MDLKSILKTIKLNENNLSMIFGLIIVLIIGLFIFKAVKNQNSNKIASTSTQNNEEGFASSAKQHVVAKGENLWSIAQKYYGSGYKWTEIAKKNNIKNPNLIAIGQSLVVEEQNGNSTTSEKVTMKNVEPITGTSYTIQKGDNLWTIAVRAYGDGYKWSQISRENKLSHPNLIHSGNTLSLPR